MKLIPMAALLLVPMVGAQQPSAQDRRGGRVGGSVRSITTGMPIPSAVVTLSSLGRKRISKTVATGAEGEFMFARLPPGGYAVRVSKTGYRTAHGERLRVRISQGGSPVLAINLWPNGAVSGRVLDTEGEPVPEAEVRVYRVSYRETGVSLPLAGRARSNDIGEYRVYGLQAGKYVARVWPPGKQTPAGLYYAEASGAYYPEALRPSQALPVSVRWGDELSDIDLRLSDEATYALVASVWDASEDGPCLRCSLSAVQIDGGFRIRLPNSVRASREGFFVLRGLTAGDYQLLVKNGNRLAGQTTVTVGGDAVTETSLAVGILQTVAGKVTLSDPPDRIDPSGWSPYLGPLNLPVSWPAGEGEIDEDLRFEMTDMPPAAYRFEMGGLPPGAYLKSLRIGGQVQAGPQVTIRNDAPVTGLEPVIAFDGASVSGRVQRKETADDEPPVGAIVHLIPRGGRNRYLTSQSVPTDSDGGFSFSVPPGSYHLLAIPPMTRVQVFDPAVQAALRSFVKQVDLDAGENASINLRLAPVGDH